MPKYKLLQHLSTQSVKRRLSAFKRSNNFKPCHSKNIQTQSDYNLVQSNFCSDRFQNEQAPSPDLVENIDVSDLEHENFIEHEDWQATLSDLEEDDDAIFKQSTFLEFVRTWAVKYNIKANALNELLHFFKNLMGYCVPVDSRTLLNTPSTRVVLDCAPGKYVHIGFDCAFETLLQNNMSTEITLDINIDGVPITRSNQSCFWPILAKASNFAFSKIFVVGVYHGYNKPNDFNQYLRPLVNELKILQSNGYFSNNTKIEVKIRSFICDAPARSSILGTKSHTAYFGCLKCEVEGEFIKNRVSFPVDSLAQMRSDDSFRKRRNIEHHKTDSILEELSINMIKQFPLEYMHLVCLGTMRKLLQMWVSGDTKSLLNSARVNAISNKISNISKTQPSDFQRRLRTLSDLGYFKATEFRTFLLYAGPFVLKDNLSLDKYNNFLFFHVGILILCHPEIYKQQVNLANEILQNFIQGVSFLYGKHHLTYNMHCLSHLSEDVKEFGPLDSFSAFSFESFMYRIKCLLRKPNQPLQQLCNRIAEINNVKLDQNKPLNVKYPICKSRKVKDGKNIYYKVILKDTEIPLMDR